MGFNTWNSFGENISADLLKETADAMVDQGLAAAGYEYIVIDDCWAERERDPKTGKTSYRMVTNHRKDFRNKKMKRYMGTTYYKRITT